MRRFERRRSHPVRNTIVGTIVLLVLFVGGGIGYTWYVGAHGTVIVQNSAKTEDTTPKPIVPTKPAANAKESASVQMLTSPIEPGTNASITVKTNAGSNCKITVVYDKTPSTDSGLGPKVADAYGNVSWTWTVGDSVPLGKWPVTVTCQFNTQSAVVIGDLVVEKAKPEL